MFKYGAPAMGMCDCVDIKILENFDKYEVSGLVIAIHLLVSVMGNKL